MFLLQFSDFRCPIFWNASDEFNRVYEIGFDYPFNFESNDLENMASLARRVLSKRILYVYLKELFFYKHIFGLQTAHQVPRDAFHSHRIDQNCMTFK